MLSFEIGQRESGFYSERTDRVTEPTRSVLVYRLHKYNFYCPTLTTYTHQLTIEYSYGTLSLIWLPKKTLEYEIVLLVTAVILLSSRRILFDFSSKI